MRACIGYAVAACILSAAIALQTKYNVHPDEGVHGDAFCYFQNHLWPPPLNIDGLQYSPDGMSRVYNEEIVYWLWGRVAAGLSPITGPLGEKINGIMEQFQPRLETPSSHMFLPLIITPHTCVYNIYTYRLLNILLLAVTLFVLFRYGRNHPWPGAVAVVMLPIPQVIYTYTYANSDAWGLSISLFLFTFAVVCSRPLAAPGSTLMLGALTGLVLLSKQPFWITLPFSYLWIAVNSRLQLGDWMGTARKSLVRNAVLLLTVILIIVTPLKIIYPLTMPDYQQQVEQMREERAWPEFKPSNLTRPGFRLAARGISFQTVWSDPGWFQSSGKSLYGYFGHLTVPLSTLQYQLAGGMLLGFVALTYWVAWVRRRSLSHVVKLALWSSPVFIGVNVLASLYNSWTYDNQPQGRYLFPSLVPLALMLTATWPYEPRWLRSLRMAGWLVAAALCLFTLYDFVLRNPALLP